MPDFLPGTISFTSKEYRREWPGQALCDADCNLAEFFAEDMSEQFLGSTVETFAPTLLNAMPWGIAIGSPEFDGQSLLGYYLLEENSDRVRDGKANLLQDPFGVSLQLRLNAYSNVARFRGRRFGKEF